MNTLCRTHINSCDFSLGNYAYNETSGDTRLKHFDISRDKQLLIPFIKDAMAVPGANFKLISSPWSPPAWMKTNGQMNHGGKLKPNIVIHWHYITPNILKNIKSKALICGVYLFKTSRLRPRFGIITRILFSRGSSLFYLTPKPPNLSGALVFTGIQEMILRTSKKSTKPFRIKNYFRGNSV